MKNMARPLTRGEIDMARSIFGDALDYGKVKVYRRRYLWFGLQPKNCAMTPNGHLYFHASCCLDDFSRGNAGQQHWFMHEMVHVWQHQLRYPVKLRGALRIGLGYAYTLAPQRRLCDYNMEAQGELLADYFALTHLRAPGAMRQPQYAESGAMYRAVLADFFADRASRANLPRRFGCWRRGGLT